MDAGLFGSAGIHRALCDACYQCFDQYQLNKHASLGTHFIFRETPLLAHQARQFLFADTTRFPTVCHLAGLDPDNVRKVTNDVDVRFKIFCPPRHDERMRATA